MNSPNISVHYYDMGNQEIEGDWYKGPGWYFVTEDEWLEGPYKTDVEASVAMVKYSEQL